MMRPIALAEFQRVEPAKVLRPALTGGPPPVQHLADSIEAEMVQQYQDAARKTSRDLGGDGDFELKARWKRKEIRKQAKAKAKALSQTYADEQKRIAAKFPTNKRDRDRAWQKFTKRKLKEHNELATADAHFSAQTDMLVQSGAVDVDKSKVMTWTLVGPNTCPICFALEAGNPYTVRRATTLGAKAHPGCVDGFVSDWEVDPALVKATKRKVKDGELKVWTGSGQTPARGSAPRLQKLMQPAAGGWKGRRTQQRRVAASVGISRSDLRQQWRDYRRAPR